MFEKFGEIKGKAKIELLNKDPSRHRPDQDTNADDEENREWKISKEEEKEAEHDRTKLKIEVDNVLATPEEMDLALKNLSTMVSGIAGNAKVELGEDEPSSTAAASGEKVPVASAAVESDDGKTFASLKTNPKMVLRHLGDTILKAKVIFESTKEGRFIALVHDAIAKHIPKLAKKFRTLEVLVLQEVAKEGSVSAASWLATATTLDLLYDEFNVINEEFETMVPKRKRVKEETKDSKEDTKDNKKPKK